MHPFHLQDAATADLLSFIARSACQQPSSISREDERLSLSLSPFFRFMPPQIELRFLQFNSICSLTPARLALSRRLINLTNSRGR
jgi:hypothetical protein